METAPAPEAELTRRMRATIVAAVKRQIPWWILVVIGDALRLVASEPDEGVPFVFVFVGLFLGLGVIYMLLVTIISWIKVFMVFGRIRRLTSPLGARKMRGQLLGWGLLNAVAIAAFIVGFIPLVESPAFAAGLDIFYFGFATLLIVQIATWIWAMRPTSKP